MRLCFSCITMIATLRHYPTVLLFVALFALTGDRCFCSTNQFDAASKLCCENKPTVPKSNCCSESNPRQSEKIPDKNQACNHCCSGLWSVTQQIQEVVSTARVSSLSIDDLFPTAHILAIHSFVPETVASVPPCSRSPIVETPGIFSHPLRS